MLSKTEHTETYSPLLHFKTRPLLSFNNEITTHQAGLLSGSPLHILKPYLHDPKYINAEEWTKDLLQFHLAYVASYCAEGTYTKLPRNCTNANANIFVVCLCSNPPYLYKAFSSRWPNSAFESNGEIRGDERLFECWGKWQATEVGRYGAMEGSKTL